MQQKSPQELPGRNGHRLLRLPTGVVFPAKCDLSVLKRNQPLVGNRHAVRVVRQILEHHVGSAERLLGVDHPVLADSHVQQMLERRRLGTRCKLAVKRQLAGLKSL